jgi:predicted TIM-barrel fold metal-dependent hydrolase
MKPATGVVLLAVSLTLAGCSSIARVEAPAVSATSADSASAAALYAPALSATPAFHDAHFHLTNYIQHGPDIEEFLQVMADQAGRVALFGIPLQQKWDYTLSGYRAPAYYLHSDAPLYYYSYVDAAIARAYQRLTPEQQSRFDPMITGFNPSDMYAAEHIRRVLLDFPGVFSGVGEFTVHKEFVSTKVSGHPASLTNPALDRIFELVAEVGLIAILHNDIDIVYPPEGNAPAYLDQVKALLRAHPNATIIWAHTGLGRVVRPTEDHLAILAEILSDPALRHVYFDISWDEVAKYVTRDTDSTLAWATLLQEHPTRFLFGTDAVASMDTGSYLKTYRDYAPLWEMLDAETSALIRKGNYERLFDAANRRVRAWEAAQLAGGARSGALPDHRI